MEKVIATLETLKLKVGSLPEELSVKFKELDERVDKYNEEVDLSETDKNYPQDKLDELSTEAEAIEIAQDELSILITDWKTAEDLRINEEARLKAEKEENEKNKAKEDEEARLKAEQEEEEEARLEQERIENDKKSQSAQSAQVEEKKGGMGIGEIFFGAVLLVVTVGLVNTFKNK